MQKCEYTTIYSHSAWEPTAVGVYPISNQCLLFHIDPISITSASIKCVSNYEYNNKIITSKRRSALNAMIEWTHIPISKVLLGKAALLKGYISAPLPYFGPTITTIKAVGLYPISNQCLLLYISHISATTASIYALQIIKLEHLKEDQLCV